MDDKSESGSTWKALNKSQWSDALDAIDVAMMSAEHWFKNVSDLEKAEACHRLSEATSRKLSPPDRLTRLVKAEMTRRNTAEVVAKSKRVKKKTAKLRKQADQLDLRRTEADQLLANVLAEQAATTAYLEELDRRVNVVYANAERAYGSCHEADATFNLCRNRPAATRKRPGGCTRPR